MEGNFGGELLVFCLCVQLMFFGVVFPMFLLYYVACFSRKLPQKFSSCQVRILEEVFGSELFVFFAFVSGCCFLVLFCLCFSFIMLPGSPESCLKNTSCQARVLETSFGSKLLVFCLCVRLVFFGVVLPMLQLYYVAWFSRKLPERFSCQVRVLEEIFGSETFGFDPTLEAAQEN